MKTHKPIGKPPADEWLQRVFSILFGLFLGLTLIKFGNPAMADTWRSLTQTRLLQANSAPSLPAERLIEWPANGYEWVLNSWPVVTGYWLLVGVIVFGIITARWKVKCPRWLIAMPLMWLVWQCVSASHTVDGHVTSATLKHFAACVACFYLGLFCLGSVRNLASFWMGLLAGFGWVLASGLFQHFGGLEEARKHFWLYIYPTMDHPSPELIKRMSSTRIFSTLFYPNALAGAILLLGPIMLNFVWRMELQFTKGARLLLVALISLSALGCLFWSGSKGGWLLMLVLGLIALLRLKFDLRWKIAVVAVVLICGLTGFTLRFSGYFKKGATSVSARFDYWRAAFQTTASHPLLGTRPGTFAISYRQIKKPDAEMARLTHNDYLQQASDSGLPGFVTYTLAIFGAAIWSARRAIHQGGTFFAVWLGLLGWTLQGFMEFGLYLPALAWPAFTFLGWLLASLANQFDKSQPTDYAPTR